MADAIGHGISPRQSFDELLPQFSSISEKELLSPTMARDDIVGEAGELYEYARYDKDKLESIGLDPAVISELPKRIGAYTYASGDYETSIFSSPESQRKWKDAEGVAYEQRSDLLADMGFAVRKSKEKTAIIRNLAAGRGARDLVLDLYDLAVFGGKNVEDLKKINFDMSRLEKAKETHQYLHPLLSDVKTSPKETAEKVLRAKQAYTYLHTAVREIREYGQHFFRNDPERLSHYKSDHYQRIGSIGKAVEVEEQQAFN